MIQTKMRKENMRSLIYTLKKSLLKDIFQKFLDGKSVGSYSNESRMREKLASCIKDKGFDVEEENKLEMYDGQSLIPDIIVHIQDKCIPIELKYRNTSIDEYEEDEQKCLQYIRDFSDVYDAYCIFVSNIDHRDYRHDEWIQCEGNSNYHYLIIPFSAKRR